MKQSCTPHPAVTSVDFITRVDLNALLPKGENRGPIRRPWRIAQREVLRKTMLVRKQGHLQNLQVQPRTLSN